MKHVEAQQARRFPRQGRGLHGVALVVGQRWPEGLSAGRVQSVAVRLLVEREKEIRAFVPEEYWELFANLLTPENAAKKSTQRDLSPYALK